METEQGAERRRWKDGKYSPKRRGLVLGVADSLEHVRPSDG